MTGEGTENLKSHAEKYGEIGWNILPCHGITSGGRCTCAKPHSEPKEVGKHPAIPEWNVKSTSEIDLISSWWEKNLEYNIGVHCSKSGLLVIDIDPRSGGPDSFEEFLKETGLNLPDTVEALTGVYSVVGSEGGRGRHIFYRCDPDETLVGNLSAMGHRGVDIKHNGYVLISPSRHFSGVTYDWVEGKAPWEIEVAQAPEELLNLLRRNKRKPGSSVDWDSFEKEPGPSIEELLKTDIFEGERAVMAYWMGCRLANKYGTDDVHRGYVVQLMIEYNATRIHPPLPLEGAGGLLYHVNRAVDFVSQNPLLPGWNWTKTAAMKIEEDAKKSKGPQKALLGVVQPSKEVVPHSDSLKGKVRSAIDRGASFSEATSMSNLDIPKDVDALKEEDGGDEKARSLSDIGNARRLVDTYGDLMRYTPGMGWFVYDTGGYWIADRENLHIQEITKSVPALVAEQAKYYPSEQAGEIIKFANNSRSSARIKATIENAKSDPRVYAPVSVWDGDPYLIGVQNGVVDLRTGELTRGSYELHITKRAPISYIQGQRNPRWENFLMDTTGGDLEYIKWLQRAAGYSMTGLNKFEHFYLVYGPPGSGKNTFLESVVKALGTKEYAWPMDSNILGGGDAMTSSTDLYHWAQLPGRRIVWIDELPDNERMKENSVKKLTGSSEISARSPGEDPFTFQSQAKLWASTNHRPIITDEAMWRRIRAIPFNRVPNVPDPTLKEYLHDPQGGLPAVFAWMVQGAIEVLSSKEIDPINWCTQVREASEMYRKNEDRVGLFFEEETVPTPGGRIPIKRLYAVYKRWSEERGERSMTQTRFQRTISDRGYKSEGTGSKSEILDLSLTIAVPTEPSSGVAEHLWSQIIPREF